MPEPSPRKALFAALFFGAFALLLLVAGAVMLWGGSQSLGWEKTEGRIVTRSVRLDRSSQQRTRRNRDQRAHDVIVTYSYSVDGQSYTGKRHSFGRGTTAASGGSREKAQAIADELYPSLSPIDVYYDPNDPEQAVLSPGLHWSAFVPLVLGGLLGLLALLGLRGAVV